MINSKRALILLTSLAAPAVFATELPTITTTASRTPVAIDNTGSAISIIDRDRILASNATSIAELLRSVPGLHVNQQGSRGAVTQIRMRGAEANQVLVLIDGVEANDIAQGGEFNFAHLSAHHVQRIEVLRGPQSALWGSDALAGVINIITAEDAAETGAFNANVETGSFGSTAANADWRIAGQTSQLQLYAHQFDTDGTNISRTGSEEDGYQNRTLGGVFRQALGNDVSLTASLRRTDTEVDFDGTDFVNTGLPTDASHETSSEQFYGRVSAEWMQLNGTLAHRLSYARTDTDNENRTGNPITDDTRSTLDQWQYQGDLYLDRHTLSLVIDDESIDFRQRGPVGFGDPNKNHDTDTVGTAIEYRYAGESIDLSASVRRENNEDFDDANTWRLTAAFQTPIEDLNVFGSIGRAVKNPTFTERFGFFTSFIGNPDLQPEESTGWEIGLRLYADERRARTSISYFNTELENEINGFVFDPASSSFTADNIDGESHRSGVEIEQEWQMSDTFSLHASYTYIDSTSENAAGRDVDEVRRPRHTASMSGHYQWEKAGLYLAVDYNGQQTDNFFPPFPAPQQVVTLDSFTLVSLAGHYALSERFTLTARVENALDDDYEEVFGFETPGLAAYAGLKFNW